MDFLNTLKNVVTAYVERLRQRNRECRGAMLPTTFPCSSRPNAEGTHLLTRAPAEEQEYGWDSTYDGLVSSQPRTRSANSYGSLASRQPTNKPVSTYGSLAASEASTSSSAYRYSSLIDHIEPSTSSGTTDQHNTLLDMGTLIDDINEISDDDWELV